MIISEDEFMHYGTPRHSGRYPWGSGGNVNNQRNRTLLDDIEGMKKQGLSDTEIARGLGMTTTEYRARKSIAKNAERQSKITMAQRLQDKGYSTNAIAKRMGIPESTARSFLAPGAKDRNDILTSTANMLREQVDEKGFIDIGKGVEFNSNLGISATTLNTAVAMLKEEGYPVHLVNIPQVTNTNQTKTKVLGPPGSTQKEVWQNPEKIQLISGYSDDHGRSYSNIKPPISIDSKRIAIKYKEDGGDQADGVIWVRPGVKDVELGGVNYAQVRVMVDNTHFIKGMAVYNKDIPEGADIVFNTSKSNTGHKLDALKSITDNPNLPFGSIISRQILDKPGSKDAKPTSVMNVINDDENWDKWTRTLSSQMLSKQSPSLAKTQLNMALEHRINDYENIIALTNPTVRKKLLLDFADNADSAATQLKAAAMPGQAVRVLLPLSSISPTHVYAPGFNNGERVVLVRHPHGGPFEIPELVVNNRNAEGKRLLGDGKNVIGIHSKVAKQLSGADFDGDTVLVIPNHRNTIKTSRPLEGLKDFDPVSSYPGYSGMRIMSKHQTQTEMGKISNLITDMSIKGASHEEVARAVRHSMVVIDAEKKGLNYKQSYTDNGIRQLVDKYQRQPDGSAGASTIISRKKSTIVVPERKPRPQSLGGPIDRKTGEKVFVETKNTYKKSGKPVTTRVSLLGEVKDASKLSSGTPMERLYVEHSNDLKALANQARRDAIRTPPTKYSPSAKKTYESEVTSLNAKLALAKSNAPLERQAQIIANVGIKQRRASNPNMDDSTLKKVKQQELNNARAKTGADKTDIKFTTHEWDAIQAGAISDSKLTEMLTHADMKIVRELATPKNQILMTPTKTARAEAMLNSGFTRAEVAQALGVSLSTLDNATNG